MVPFQKSFVHHLVQDLPSMIQTSIHQEKVYNQLHWLQMLNLQISFYFHMASRNELLEYDFKQVTNEQMKALT